MVAVDWHLFWAKAWQKMALALARVGALFGWLGRAILDVGQRCIDRSDAANVRAKEALDKVRHRYE